MFNAGASKFDTNVVIDATFGLSSGYCQINGFVIIQHRFDLEWKKSDTIW